MTTRVPKMIKPAITLAIALFVLALSPTCLAQSAYCPADLNFDRTVDAADLSQLLLDFGACEGCPADLNLDASVDGGDISQILLDFGPCPDDNGGSDCPAHGTLKDIRHSQILYNGLPVGERWWEERYSGVGSSPDCSFYNTNYESECYEYGREIARDSNFVYKADGNCAYFTVSAREEPPCPAYATVAQIDWSYPIVVTPSEGGCGQSFQVGLGARNLYHDGNCGTFWAATYWRVWWWYPSGHIIGQCGNYTFRSNGTGGYYAESNCPPAGTALSSSSYPITINVIGVDWEVGVTTNGTYADGSCGSYDSSSTVFLPSGTLLGSDGTLDYFSDGAGGYYSAPTGPDCDDSGTVLSTDSTPIVTSDCGLQWTVGSTTTTTYADGSCGTYQQTSTEYLPYGTLLGTDGSANYFSNGSGGCYTEPVGGGGCDPSGTLISYFSSPLYVYGSSYQWEIGTQYTATYADGQCGTYSDSGAVYLPYGSYLGSDGQQSYYSDGSGGYYTG